MSGSPERKRVLAVSEAISRLFTGVLSGSLEEYRYDGYVRWGAVENEIRRLVMTLAEPAPPPPETEP